MNICLQDFGVKVGSSSRKNIMENGIGVCVKGYVHKSLTVVIHLFIYIFVYYLCTKCRVGYSFVMGWMWEGVLRFLTCTTRLIVVHLLREEEDQTLRRNKGGWQMMKQFG